MALDQYGLEVVIVFEEELWLWINVFTLVLFKKLTLNRQWQWKSFDQILQLIKKILPDGMCENQFKSLINYKYWKDLETVRYLDGETSLGFPFIIG